MIEMHWGKLSEGGGHDRWRSYLVYWREHWNPRIFNPKVKFLSTSEAQEVLNAFVVAQPQPLRADWMRIATMWQFLYKEASK